MNVREYARRYLHDRMDAYVRIYEYQAVQVVRSDEATRGVAISVSNKMIPRSDELCFDLIETLRATKMVDHLQMMYMAILFGDGPKVFRPTAKQLFALEQMTVNVEIADFHLPFKMIAVELPDEYAKTKIDSHGEQPVFATLFKDKATNFIGHNVMYPSHALKAHYVPFNTDLVEDWFTTDDFEKNQGSLLSTPEEESNEMQIRRALVNYCLLLDECGIKNAGNESPNELSQLVKWVKKNNVHTARNKRMMKAIPFVYELATKPAPLVRYVGSASELPVEETGRKVKPHCRRGHYRMHAYGPKLSERKRIRVAPVFVNAHLMTGGMDGTYRS